MWHETLCGCSLCRPYCNSRWSTGKYKGRQRHELSSTGGPFAVPSLVAHLFSWNFNMLQHTFALPLVLSSRPTCSYVEAGPLTIFKR